MDKKFCENYGVLCPSLDLAGRHCFFLSNVQFFNFVVWCSGKRSLGNGETVIFSYLVENHCSMLFDARHLLLFDHDEAELLKYFCVCSTRTINQVFVLDLVELARNCSFCLCDIVIRKLLHYPTIQLQVYLIDVLENIFIII